MATWICLSNVLSCRWLPDCRLVLWCSAAQVGIGFQADAYLEGAVWQDNGAAFLNVTPSILMEFSGEQHGQEEKKGHSPS